MNLRTVWDGMVAAWTPVFRVRRFFWTAYWCAKANEDQEWTKRTGLRSILQRKNAHPDVDAA